MANDGEDGNGFPYRFLRQDVSFSKVQVSLGTKVVAVWIRDHFVNL